MIKNNDDDGIDMSGSGHSPLVERCVIYDNNNHGIYADNSYPTVRDCTIHHNGADETGQGIHLKTPSSQAEIHNNTIVYNADEGIERTGDTAPDISNCIIWYNDSDDTWSPLVGCWADHSCVTDPNDPNGVAAGADEPDGNDNIRCDPSFAYDDPDFYDFHLDPNSPCIDLGDPNDVIQDETDIDGDDRINGDSVDIGADEVACEGVRNEDVDWNADGTVNMIEFADISAAWLTVDPNYTEDPNEYENWNPICDLDESNDIDLADLIIFCEEHWLWLPCWYNADTWVPMAMGQGGGSLGRAIAPSPTFVSAQQIEAYRIAKWQLERPPYQPTIEEQIDQIEPLVDWLEELWKTSETIIEEAIGEEEWEIFMDKVYEYLKELYDQL